LELINRLPDEQKVFEKDAMGLLKLNLDAVFLRIDLDWKVLKNMSEKVVFSDLKNLHLCTDLPTIKTASYSLDIINPILHMDGMVRSEGSLYISRILQICSLNRIIQFHCHKNWVRYWICKQRNKHIWVSFCQIIPH